MAFNHPRKIDVSSTSIKDLATFSQIGGLSEHIRLLKELVIFPLVYSNVYNRFKIKAPRGVLFYGPPGTGKTLVAGALAKECSKGIFGKVTFFSRKGADILDKWVGESEQRLRALFAKAADRRPSIIFFDEIDGLAPIRSSRQDQIHSSIVATLLALMDGLDKFPGVVVIGATNRLDAIDPALRRPGRFDREMYFPLPAVQGRREILEVYVNNWKSKPKASFISYLADITAGYCGSDLQALCSEAVMTCLKRIYPGIHTSSKINVSPKQLKVEECDFMAARTAIMPSVQRDLKPMRPLSTVVKPLLEEQLFQILDLIKSKWPHFAQTDYKYQIGASRYAGRMLLLGEPNQGHNTHMAPALLHALEYLPSYVIDIQSLYESASHTAEEICVQKLTQARQNLPSIVLAYRLDEWWNIVEQSTRAVLRSLLEDLHAGLPLLIIATATNDLPASLAEYFNNHNSVIVRMGNPTERERQNFLHPLFMENAYAICAEHTEKFSRFPSTDKTSVFFKRNGSMVSTTAGSVVSHCHSLFGNPSRSVHKNRSVHQWGGNPYHLNRGNGSCVQKRGLPPNRNVPQSTMTVPPKHVQPYMSQMIAQPSYPMTRSQKQAMRQAQQPAASPSTTWNPFTRAINMARRIQNSITQIVTHDKTSYLNSKNKNKVPKSNKNTAEGLMNNNCPAHSPGNNMAYNSGDANGQNMNEFVPAQSNSMLDRLNRLFSRAVSVTTADMNVASLELFYDMVSACISREKDNAPRMLEGIKNIMADFEYKNETMRTM